MHLARLITRNLLYYRRTNGAVLAGVAIAVAVLAGALLVGRSVRGSLRSLLYQRIGATEYLVSANRFFREELAEQLGPESAPRCPIIFLQGIVIHQTSGSRALNVNVYGVDERFWKFQGIAGQDGPQDRTALVGAALAQKLGIHPGDGLLLRMENQQGIPKESLYGHRENIGRTMRLVSGQVVTADRLGEFALRPGQGIVYSIFVSLRRLQKELGQASGANAILLSSDSQEDKLDQIRDSLRKTFALQDLGIKLRPLAPVQEISVESSRIILDDSIANAAFEAASETGMKASPVFTYLANSIRAGGREIPYSVISAVDLQAGAMTSVHRIGNSAPVDAGSAIWLSEWAAQDLAVTPGDPVEIDYYVWQEEGVLATRTARFRLAGVVSIGGDVDVSLAPEFPGITDARSIGAWDPPFPVDLSRIRPKDEEYWDRYKTTPKAFISLARGQQLWQSRFGKVSAVRVAFPAGADLNSAQESLARNLRNRLNPEQAGFSVNNLKEQGLNASQGSTDFGEYFVYFSLFLIAAAVLLTALFFRLGIEQRGREIGVLQAVGFSRGGLHRIFLTEGALVSIAGSALGALGSLGYGWLLVFGLRTWWVDAVGTRRLSLHVSMADLAAGSAAGFITSLGAIVWTFYRMRLVSPRALLAGAVESVPARRAIEGGSLRPRWFGAKHRARQSSRNEGTSLLALFKAGPHPGSKLVSAAGFAAALVMLLGSMSGMIGNVEGFFGAGFLLLVSALSATALCLRRIDARPVASRGWHGFVSLGLRNAAFRPGRSLLCISLIASATFIIVAMEAFRRDPRDVTLERKSGTGGYSLLAQSALPIVQDPNGAAGREALGIAASDVPELAPVKFVPFRVRPGDDASCLNLYAPREPMILGVPRAFVSEARFSFQDALASTPGEKQNPWLLLESGAQDGTIPAIGDANTIQYILHLAVGRELTVRRGDGTPVRLRLVAALRDSIFQGELLVSETGFLQTFPEQEGFRFFLLDAPPARSASLIQSLEEHLADWGFSVESTRDRLAAYHQVENTYLSTFQSLGALGLMLGTAGLATVLLRNVLERRKELALLRAVGYRKRVVSGIIVAESLALLVWGLACGSACALLAIAPALHARGMSVPAAMIGVTLLGVLVVGLASSVVAVVAASRSPLLEALRSE